MSISLDSMTSSSFPLQPQSSGTDTSATAKLVSGGSDILNSFAGNAPTQSKGVDFSSLGDSSNSDSLSTNKCGGGQADQGSTLLDKMQKVLSQMIDELLQMILSQLGNKSGGDADNSAQQNNSPFANAGIAPPQQKSVAPAGDSGGSPAASPAASTAAAATPSTGDTSATSTATPALSEKATVSQGTGDGSTGLHLPDALKPLEGDIKNAADKSGMKPETLAGMAWAESRGKSSASTVNSGNGGNDTGVFQVNDSTAKAMYAKYPDKFDGSDLSTTKNNAVAGALYLKDMTEQFGGNEAAGLRAYNSGPGNVNIKDLSDISKTNTGAAPYVDNVQKFAEIMKTGNGQLPA